MSVGGQLWFDDEGHLNVNGSVPMSGWMDSLSRHLGHFLARVEASDRAADGTFLLRDAHAGSLGGGALVLWERVVLLAQAAMTQTFPGMTAEERETYDQKGFVAKAVSSGRNARPLIDALRQITFAILYGSDNQWVDHIPADSIRKLKALHHEVDLFRDQCLRSERLVAEFQAAEPTESAATSGDRGHRVWSGLVARFRSVAEATTSWEQAKRLYPVLRDAGQALLEGVAPGVIPAPKSFAAWLRAEVERDLEEKQSIPEHKRAQRSDAELLWLDPYCRGFEEFCAKHTRGLVDPPACGWGAFDSRGRNEDQVRAMLVERAQAYAKCCDALATFLTEDPPPVSHEERHAGQEPAKPVPDAIHFAILSLLVNGRRHKRESIATSLRETFGRNAVFMAIREMHGWGWVDAAWKSKKGAAILEAGRSALEQDRKAQKAASGSESGVTQ